MKQHVNAVANTHHKTSDKSNLNTIKLILKGSGIRISISNQNRCYEWKSKGITKL